MKRRDFLRTGGGALVVYFGLPAVLTARGQEGAADMPVATLDAWLAVDTHGDVTVFTGKVELGTGVETAFTQLVADELDVDCASVRLVMGDTARCPDQFPTVGSLSVYRAGPQLRRAAAEARLALLELASQRLGAAVGELRVANGRVTAPGGGSLGYADLIGGRRFERRSSGRAVLKAPADLQLVGQSLARVELPGKVYGTHEFIHNLRIPGMLHGRVVRPPLSGAAPARIDADGLATLPGKPQLVTRGAFVGVVAEQEHHAERAAAALRIEWGSAPALPGNDHIAELLRSAAAADRELVNNGDVDRALGRADRVLQARYETPYQLHASIGPACALADVKPDRATLWSATQSSFPLRDSLAALLALPPERVRLVWIEGSGCYGHNGADDCTADAAVLSQQIGRPVRVQYSRTDEMRWEPKGTAMCMEVRGALDAGGVLRAWDYQVWSHNHISSRPFAPGNLLAGAEIGLAGKEVEVGAERNAMHAYAIPNYRAVLHLLHDNPVRSSSLRGLGSPQNTFANESFIDELAAAAGSDPLAYRLKYLRDARAIAVLEEVARISQWQLRPSPRRNGGPRPSGRGVAFVQYANYSAYVATVIQVAVEPASGAITVERVWVAHDCGLIVNPDGVRNQIEGNVIQTLSRALKEELRFGDSGFETTAWSDYPILRFSEVPDDIVVSLINRPEHQALGAGEPAASPVFAALANAVFDATGARLRRIPFTPERVRRALQHSG